MATTTAKKENDCLSRIDNVRGINLYSQNDEDGALLQRLRYMYDVSTNLDDLSMGSDYDEFNINFGLEWAVSIIAKYVGKEEKALALTMQIPSVDNFPKLHPTALHKYCTEKAWKLTDHQTMKMKATQPKISHADFAGGLPEVTLLAKEFGYPKSNWWRVFY
eukprot:9615713-Ditylum_brightwellii.AAC.1